MLVFICKNCGKRHLTRFSTVHCYCGHTIQVGEPVENRFLMRILSRLQTPEDRGIGDTVQRIAAKFGGERFKRFAKHIGLPCGCTGRQARWNADYPNPNYRG